MAPFHSLLDDLRMKIRCHQKEGLLYGIATLCLGVIFPCMYILLFGMYILGAIVG